MLQYNKAVPDPQESDHTAQTGPSYTALQNAGEPVLLLPASLSHYGPLMDGPGFQVYLSLANEGIYSLYGLHTVPLL